MNDGLRIFNTEPLVEKLYLSMYSKFEYEYILVHISIQFKLLRIDKDTDKIGSVAIAEMLDRTNLIAVVSGGNYPIIAPNSG